MRGGVRCCVDNTCNYAVTNLPIYSREAAAASALIAGRKELSIYNYNCAFIVLRLIIVYVYTHTQVYPQYKGNPGFA